MQHFKEKRRQRFLSEEEFARLGATLRYLEESGREPASAVAAIRLLILTGCRQREILSMRWEDLDFERNLIHFPDSKTGARTIPMSKPVRDLLKSLPHYLENPYVLPGRVPGGHLVGLSHIWHRVRDRAEIPDVRLHQLRHTFATFGAGGGLGLPILGKLLGHRSSATAAREQPNQAARADADTYART